MQEGKEKKVVGVNYKNHRLRKETLGESIELNAFVNDMDNSIGEGKIQDLEKSSGIDLEFKDEEENFKDACH